MAAPRFNRNDTAYLASSAAIGHLEGYTIGDVVQVESGRWQYRIDFNRKPPEQASVGDRIRLQPLEGPVFYKEDEFLTLCEALAQAVAALQRQLAKVQGMIASRCVLPTARTPEGEPRFAIGDTVWFRASAKLGFVETATVKSIASRPVGTAATTRRYVYTLNTRSDLYFNEDELGVFCDIAGDVVTSLTGQLVVLRERQARAQCA